MAGEHVWNDFIGAFLGLFQQDRFAREDKIDEADGGSAGHLQRKREELKEERSEEKDKPLTCLRRDPPTVYTQVLPPHLASFPVPGPAFRRLQYGKVVVGRAWERDYSSLTC